MRKSIVLAASTALLASCPAAVATAASTHQHASHGSSHGSSHGKPPTRDRLAGPRKGATHAITAQLKSLSALQKQLVAYAGADAAGLQAALGADADAVRADLAQVATATSIGSLRQLTHAALVTRQIARTQAHDVVAADVLGTKAAGLNTTLTTVEASLADLATAGTDTSAGTTTLTDDAATLTAAVGQVGDVVQAVLAISPTASNTVLHEAAVAANQELGAIADSLDAVSTDIDAVQVEYNL